MQIEGTELTESGQRSRSNRNFRLLREPDRPPTERICRLLGRFRLSDGPIGVPRVRFAPLGAKQNSARATRGPRSREPLFALSSLVPHPEDSDVAQAGPSTDDKGGPGLANPFLPYLR